jgi:predicted hydrocarbon binding protein
LATSRSSPEHVYRSNHGKVEFPFFFSKDERSVQIVAELRDEPGSLSTLLTELATRVNLIGTSSYSMEGNRAIFSAFGKILSPADNAQSIQQLGSSVSTVRSCWVWEDNQGLLVDRYHYGLQSLSGERYVMQPVAALGSTFDALVRIFGSGAEVILYNQGLEYAKSRWAGISKVFGPHPETRLGEVAALVRAMGWAEPTITYDPNTSEVRCVNTQCFECSAPLNDHRDCSFLRGMAAGLIEGMFGTQMNSEETRCIKKGDDVCEFVLTPRVGN